MDAASLSGGTEEEIAYFAELSESNSLEVPSHLGDDVFNLSHMAVILPLVSSSIASAPDAHGQA